MMESAMAMHLSNVWGYVKSHVMRKARIETDIRVRTSWQGKEGSLLGILWPWACSFYVMPRSVKGHMKKKGILGGSMDPYMRLPLLREGAAYTKWLKLKAWCLNKNLWLGYFLYGICFLSGMSKFS